MSRPGFIMRTCHCGKTYEARKADVDRGWARSCSKSCAAIKREKKTGTFKRLLRGDYDPPEPVVGAGFNRQFWTGMNGPAAPPEIGEDDFFEPMHIGDLDDGFYDGESQ